MRLFIIDANNQVELNKEWIMLIPEFANLLKRDKGSQGDYRGEKKLKARKELAFIYFDLDFASPIREWEDYERRQEAMLYAGLKEADLDAEVMAAHSRYELLLLGSSRSLKTLKAVEKSLDAMDNYFHDLDFTLTDKKGELVHNPNSYLMNLERLGKAYDSVDKFRKRVEEELKSDNSVRGNSSLGRKEGKRTEWREGGIQETESAEERIPAAVSTSVKQTSFRDIAKLLHGADSALSTADDSVDQDLSED